MAVILKENIVKLKHFSYIPGAIIYSTLSEVGSVNLVEEEIITPAGG